MGYKYNKYRAVSSIELYFVYKCTSFYFIRRILKGAKMTDYVKGYFVLFLTIIFISMDSVTIRFAGMSGVSTAFWRNIGIALVMAIIAISTYGYHGFKKHLLAVKPKQVLQCLLFGVSGTFFVLAIQSTSVVNVLLMFVLSPLLAVIMSKVFLKEHINRVVKFTSVFVIGGTFLAYKDSFDAGLDIGILYAFMFVVANSGMSIVGRSLKTVPSAIMIMIGCSFWGVLLAFTELDAPVGLFAMGSMFANVLIISLGYWATVYASKSISAPEVNLMLITETVLGSIAAWIFLNEIPTAGNIMGGLVAMIAIIINLSYALYLQCQKKKAVQRQSIIPTRANII